jgi:hypothetical protein
MDARRDSARRALRRARRDAVGHWHGAAIIGAVAASDLAYRLLMREPLRRALGIETRRA